MLNKRNSQQPQPAQPKPASKSSVLLKDIKTLACSGASLHPTLFSDYHAARLEECPGYEAVPGRVKAEILGEYTQIFGRLNAQYTTVVSTLPSVGGTVDHEIVRRERKGAEEQGGQGNV